MNDFEEGFIRGMTVTNMLWILSLSDTADMSESIKEIKESLVGLDPELIETIRNDLEEILGRQGRIKLLEEVLGDDK